MLSLRDRVFSALKTALDNGYNMTTDDPDAIEVDLRTCDVEFAAMSESLSLKDHIVEWQKTQKGQG